MKPELSILIATQGRRNQRFQNLLKGLMRQVRPFKGQIEVIAYWNNGELPIGTIREYLIKEAGGEYVCFIDDDDAVPPYYCEEIMKALGEDYVGFKVKLFNDGVEKPPAYHDLQYSVWYEDEHGYYRGVTHLNPIKKSLAQLGDYTLNGAGEDAMWAKTVTPHVKTQNFIDKIMYFYYHDRSDTSFGGAHKYREIKYTRPDIKYKYFRYHHKSKGTNNETH